MHVQSFPFTFSFPVPDFLSRSRPFTLLYPCPLPVLPLSLQFKQAATPVTDRYADNGS